MSREKLRVKSEICDIWLLLTDFCKLSPQAKYWKDQAKSKTFVLLTASLILPFTKSTIIPGGNDFVWTLSFIADIWSFDKSFIQLYSWGIIIIWWKSVKLLSNSFHCSIILRCPLVITYSNASVLDMIQFCREWERLGPLENSVSTTDHVGLCDVDFVICQQGAIDSPLETSTCKPLRLLN